MPRHRPVPNCSLRKTPLAVDRKLAPSSHTKNITLRSCYEKIMNGVIKAGFLKRTQKFVRCAESAKQAKAQEIFCFIDMITQIRKAGKNYVP